MGGRAHGLAGREGDILMRWTRTRNLPQQAKTIGLALVAATVVYQVGSTVTEARQERREAARKAAIIAAFPADPDAEAIAVLKERYGADIGSWPAPKVQAGAKLREMEPFTVPPRPEGEALAKATLGRRLFDDRHLSESGQIACQSCHNRELGWGDGLRTSFGHDRQKGKRNAPPLFSAAWRPELFWDGRAVSLQQQASAPMTDTKEMANHDLDAMVERLNRDSAYRETFRGVYGKGRITLDRVTDALAAYQATLEERTPFDRFMAGNRSALSDEQVWGLHLFRTKAGCMNCHNGPLLTDDRYHNLGLSLLGRPLEDTGRYGVSRAFEDVGRFRTPSLRHVRETRPYMHNGLIRELRLVVRFYESGGGRTRPRNDREAANPLMPYAGKTSDLVQSFDLNGRERQALVSFLEAL